MFMFSVCVVEQFMVSVCLVEQSENRTCERSKHRTFCCCLLLPFFNVFNCLSVV